MSRLCVRLRPLGDNLLRSRGLRSVHVIYFDVKFTDDSLFFDRERTFIVLFALLENKD
jgi:hypothetical protein